MRLAEAAKLPPQQVTGGGAIVIAFNNLREELRRRPSKLEVRQRVDRWYKEGGRKPMTHRHWLRILADPLIAALFREG